MVSTRSGRVVSASETAGTRLTRARSKKDADDALEPVEEMGQPEVSSPAPSLLFSGLKPSRDTPGAFGSPAAFALPQTPAQDSMAGTPLNERVVKTVGRTPAAQTPGEAPQHTPAVATLAPAPTPSAKAVKQIASVPLPDDAASDETEPFASSEDDPADPASPGAAASQPPAAPTSLRTHPRAAAGSSGRLFGVFATASVLVTILIALILTPCASPELYAMMSPATYKPICKGVSNIYDQAAEAAWRVRAEAADQAAALRKKLPPQVQDLVAQAWEPVQQAHTAALPLLTNAGTELEQRLAPLLAKVAEAWQTASRELYVRLAPALDAGLGRFRQGNQAAAPAATAAPAAASQAPSFTAVPPYTFPISQEAFLATIEPKQHQFVQELWLAAGRQVATKRKAIAWVLACDSEAEREAAKGVLFVGASDLVHIDGASYSEEHSAGALQRDLVSFLRAFPQGMILVTNPTRLHVNSVAVLNAALSESGHLQMDGVPVATERAFYVILEQADDAVDDQAVKDKLVAALTAPGAENASAIALSFRRRLDAVLRVHIDSSGTESFGFAL